MKRTYAPDPRPAKRIVNYEAGKERREQAYAGDYTCPGCGETVWQILPRGYGFSRFHLVGIDLGGDDVEENIKIVCGDGTRGCHGTWENHEPGWEEVAGRIRSSLTDAELRYVVAKKGTDWLERYLPSTRRTEPSE